MIPKIIHGYNYNETAARLLKYDAGYVTIIELTIVVIGQVKES